MASTAAPRPGEKRVGRAGVERKHRCGIKIARQVRRGLARPLIHRIAQRVPLADKAPEHLRPRIAHEDDKGRAFGNSISGARLKPAEGNETRPADRCQDRVFQCLTPARIARLHH